MDTSGTCNARVLNKGVIIGSPVEFKAFYIIGGSFGSGNNKIIVENISCGIYLHNIIVTDYLAHGCNTRENELDLLHHQRVFHMSAPSTPDYSNDTTPKQG